MTAVTVPLVLSAGTTLSVSVISAASIIGAFLLRKHLHFLAVLAHQLESDIGCYILHVDRPTTSLSLHFRHWEYRMWK